MEKFVLTLERAEMWRLQAIAWAGELGQWRHVDLTAGHDCIYISIVLEL